MKSSPPWEKVAWERCIGRRIRNRDARWRSRFSPTRLARIRSGLRDSNGRRAPPPHRQLPLNDAKKASRHNNDFACAGARRQPRPERTGHAAADSPLKSDSLGCPSDCWQPLKRPQAACASSALALEGALATRTVHGPRRRAREGVAQAILRSPINGDCCLSAAARTRCIDRQTVRSPSRRARQVARPHRRRCTRVH